MQHIIKLAPKRVVYVSCNPATLARDSEALISAGYQIQRLAMLDMFPHTGHLESMVLFEHAQIELQDICDSVALQLWNPLVTV
jgi:23S rRNA (uracil1939-C5)-methyltransferase